MENIIFYQVPGGFVEGRIDTIWTWGCIAYGFEYSIKLCDGGMGVGEPETSCCCLKRRILGVEGRRRGNGRYLNEY
jgi:hypothetical protein